MTLMGRTRTDPTPTLQQNIGSVFTRFFFCFRGFVKTAGPTTAGAEREWRSRQLASQKPPG